VFSYVIYVVIISFLSCIWQTAFLSWNTSKWELNCCCCYIFFVCWWYQNVLHCKYSTDSTLPQSDVDSIRGWCAVNLILANVITYTRKNITINHIYKLCDKCITHSYSIKDLGILWVLHSLFTTQNVDSIQALTYCFSAIYCLLYCILYYLDVN
jgi:hypothetical protein